MESHQLKNRAVSANAEVNGMIGSNDRDVNALARLGKKPVLRRTFGILSTLGFSCTILATWEGLFEYESCPHKNLHKLITSLARSSCLYKSQYRKSRHKCETNPVQWRARRSRLRLYLRLDRNRMLLCRSLRARLHV